VALEITTDELLRPRAARLATTEGQPKVLRRLEQSKACQSYQQRALLTTIDNFIAAAQDR